MIGDEEYNEAIKQWQDPQMTEADVNKFGRTHADRHDNFMPFHWVLPSDNEKTYDTFQECFAAIEGGTANVEDSIKKEYREITEDPFFQTGIQFINYFENEYECSGTCKEALFFY